MMKPEMVRDFIRERMKFDPVANAAVFNTMRILKRLNEGDSYYENYRAHYKKRGKSFFDYYHLLWHIGAGLPVTNIMEIGCRTGISICQLLSAMYDYNGIRVVLFDVFNDGFISPEIVKLNLKALNIPRDIVEFVTGSSASTVINYQVDNPETWFDYILVDGDHNKDAARQDLENVLSMINPGGILVFDDIGPDGCNLLDVWESFKEDHFDDFYWHHDLNGKGVGIGVKK